MSERRAAGPRQMLSRLCVATLVVVLTLPLTWMVYWSVLLLGWVGLGLLILSLPVGPTLAVLVSRRLLAPVHSPALVPVIVGTWVGVAAVLTTVAFLGRYEALVEQLNPFLSCVAGAFLGALGGASLPTRSLSRS